MHPDDEEYTFDTEQQYKLDQWVNEGFIPVNPRHMVHELLDENHDLRAKVATLIYELRENSQELRLLRQYKKEKEQKEQELKKKFASLQLD